MKKIAFGYTIVILALVVTSCSNDESVPPVTPSDTYFGKIGTKRYYTITTRWFQQGTTTPFIAVPDSLRQRVSLADSQLSTGVCEVWDLCETVDSLYSLYKDQFPLPLSSYKLVGNGRGLRYELLDELDALEHGRGYAPHVAGLNSDIILLELPDVDWIVHMTAQERQFPTMPYMRKPITVGSSWTRWRAADPVSGQPTQEQLVDVLSRVVVTVPAGTFEAYKLAITISRPDYGYKLFDCFEYYVPNIGLVLREIDRNECQWNSQTGNTICFRDVTRMELNSYNLIR